MQTHATVESCILCM